MVSGALLKLQRQHSRGEGVLETTTKLAIPIGKDIGSFLPP